MSSFCRQCTNKFFQCDDTEMKNLCTIEDNINGLYTEALCENCGHIQVDHNGSCVSNCTENHYQQLIKDGKVLHEKI